jgi:trehalose 6-phosphate synthase
MRLNLRMTFTLLACVAVVSMAFAAYQGEEEVRALKDEMQRQAAVLADSQLVPVRTLLRAGSASGLQTLVGQFHDNGYLAGVAVYDSTGQPLARTAGLPAQFDTAIGAVTAALLGGPAASSFTTVKGERIHIFALPVGAEGRTLGAIGVFHHAAFLGLPVWRHAASSVAQTLLIVGITLLVIRWSLAKPLRHMAQWLHDLRLGKVSLDSRFPREEMFKPLASEVTWLASSLSVARAAAEEEARLRDASLSLWTAERLRIAMEGKLKGSRLFAVSNREPYEHRRQGGGVVCSVPPSGLVTALEPILRACDGTWIAQATGDADRETADEQGRLRVPPDDPRYKLRRVWLSREEEQGYYFGFANEGLWPLCHIAHTRPIFATEDWNQYQAVNRKFAAAVLDEMDGEKEPFVLVQDYHFALLPRLLKRRRPDARIALFWHIPWPNPEAFGICPWQRQLLDGMLGADLIGFHIQAHCNNFLATVDRALESRIDNEHFAVSRQDHLTIVKPFPISVAFNGDSAAPRSAEDLSAERTRLLHQLGVEARFLGVGVDRVDYTKGIPERFRGIERLLDSYPEYCEKLTFVQIGAPSRTRIKRYQDLMVEVEAEAERINRRFRTDSWAPIVFLKRNHSHDEIQPYYRAADFCLVTSLHDGMNLVAKEYIAARQDRRGALILSRFTGASHELADALAINPYDMDELAQAIHTVLTMPDEEKSSRMDRMRAVVKEHNVYRWAGNLIGELAEVRVGAAAGTARERAASRPLHPAHNPILALRTYTQRSHPDDPAPTW